MRFGRSPNQWTSRWGEQVKVSGFPRAAVYRVQVGAASQQTEQAGSYSRGGWPRFGSWGLRFLDFSWGCELSLVCVFPSLSFRNKTVWFKELSNTSRFLGGSKNRLLQLGYRGNTKSLGGMLYQRSVFQLFALLILSYLPKPSSPTISSPPSSRNCF